ncbi:GNS1/SUR4 family-domain-containing protein, partial [Jimgerdemannia flammicorona]
KKKKKKNTVVRLLPHLLEQGPEPVCLLLLPLQILRDCRHHHYSAQGPKIESAADVPPLWRHPLHVGRGQLPRASDLDLCHLMAGVGREVDRESHTILMHCIVPLLSTSSNSFIHTIMYFYYAATTVGLSPPFKQNLTQLQITQFLTGQVLGIYYLFGTESNCIPDTGARLAIWLVIFYSLPLVWLFIQFARRIYGGINKAATAKKGAKE